MFAPDDRNTSAGIEVILSILARVSINLRTRSNAGLSSTPSGNTIPARLPGFNKFIQRSMNKISVLLLLILYKSNMRFPIFYPCQFLVHNFL